MLSVLLPWSLVSWNLLIIALLLIMLVVITRMIVHSCVSDQVECKSACRETCLCVCVSVFVFGICMLRSISPSAH